MDDFQNAAPAVGGTMTDLHSAGELASGLPAARRGLLLARIALDSGDHTPHTTTCRQRRWPA